MPYLHLFIEFLSVDGLIDLQMLERVEVHVGEEATALDLLLVEFSEVGDGWEVVEAGFDVVTSIALLL